MLKSYDFEGKNVDEALAKASKELNIPVEKINHDVIAYGSSGIFGLVGVKKAKIKVFVKEKNTTSAPIRKEVESDRKEAEKETETADDPQSEENKTTF